MRMRYVLLTSPLLLLLLANEDTLKGRVAGASVDCLSDMDTRSQAEIIDSSTIGYSRTSKRIWITHPEGSCAALRPMQALIVERRGAQLCRGDRFRTVRAPAMVPSGVCHFGPFTPYDKAG